MLLVCLSFTSAEAQSELLWQHSDGRLVVWTMQGTNSLSDGMVLMIFGGIYATSTPAGIFSQELGRGEIYHLPPRGSSWSMNDATGWCYIDRFEMVSR